MIEFNAITYFLQRITALKAVRRGVYATVEDEISNSFSGHDIEDRKHKLSKKDGYRLIYIVYKDREEVGLLDVYPKNGPLQQLDIDDKQVLNLVQQYLEEKVNGTLSSYSIK